MNLDDLQLFCRISSLGSFAAAAAELGISKGTASRRLQLLEQQLATALIRRSTRKLELTEPGKALYGRCQPLIAELEEIRDQVADSRLGLSGPLSILLPMEFFAPQFDRLLFRFTEQYPDISINCRHYVERSPSFVSAEDLCFAWFEDRLPDSDWIAMPLISLPQACYAGSADIRISRAEALTEQPCITQPDEQAWLFRSGRDRLRIGVSGSLQFNSPGMRIQATINSGGICKLPIYLAEPYVQAGQLHRLDLDVEPLALTVAILYRNLNQPARVRAFMDFFQSNIGSE